MEEAELAGYEAIHADDHGRCPRCGYVRHPCDVRELVAEVRRLRGVGQRWVEGLRQDGTEVWAQELARDLDHGQP